MATKVKLVRSMMWVHQKTAQWVSIHGAVPWSSPADKPNWKIEEVGWTTYNIRENTYGFGRQPFSSKDGLEAFLKAHPDQFEIVAD